MEWWRIFSVVVLQVCVSSFFVYYLLQRQTGQEADNDRLEYGKEKTQPPTLSKAQRRNGCVGVIKRPFASGIFATIFLAYIFAAMFLLIPLHPTPNDGFWQFAISGLILTLIIYLPIAVFVIVRIRIEVHTRQVNIYAYFLQTIVKSLLLLFFIETLIWFGIHE